MTPALVELTGERRWTRKQIPCNVTGRARERRAKEKCHPFLSSSRRQMALDRGKKRAELSERVV
jgi:hypothetical protein